MPSSASRLCSSVVALARGIPSEHAARVKLLVSTMRTNVRIAMMRSITGVSPMDLEAPHALLTRGAYDSSQFLIHCERLVATASGFVLRSLSRPGICTVTHVVITIVKTQPLHHVALFVPPLRGEVEQGISADERLAAASIYRERMEHITRIVLVEHAEPGQFVAVESPLRDVARLEVVVHLTFFPLLRR